MSGIKEHVSDFIQKFNARLQLGTVKLGPGYLKSYGMTIVQFQKFSCTIHADKKLNNIECFPLFAFVAAIRTHR